MLVASNRQKKGVPVLLKRLAGRRTSALSDAAFASSERVRMQPAATRQYPRSVNADSHYAFVRNPKLHVWILRQSGGLG
jgi:hypothetical protein